MHHHKADSGRHGEGNDRDGRHGDDKIIQVVKNVIISNMSIVITSGTNRGNLSLHSG